MAASFPLLQALPPGSIGCFSGTLLHDAGAVKQYFNDQKCQRISLEEFCVEVGNNWPAAEFHIQRHETRFLKGEDASAPRAFSTCLFPMLVFVFVSPAIQRVDNQMTFSAYLAIWPLCLTNSTVGQNHKQRNCKAYQ